MKKIKNIHCFLSPMLNESRVLKETKSLIQLKLVNEIRILAYWERGLKKQEKIDEDREIVRLMTIPKTLSLKNSLFRKIVAFIGLIEINIKYLFHIYRYKSDFISCHNLMLLPICATGKLITKSKLLYVPHELETERTGLDGLLKKVSKIVEKKFINYADKIMVVCEPIAKWYRANYNLNNVFVLRNVPYNPYINKPLVKSNKLREIFNIPDDHLVFIYQGIISESRGCFDLIEIFKKSDTDRHLILMGFGDLVPYLINISNEYDNIHYKESVPVNEIIEYTSSADVGMFFLPFEISLSYRYSLPNKFFEYLLGGLPVIVSDNLEYLASIVSNDDLGWVVEDNNSSLHKLINSLVKNSLPKSNIENYTKNIGWRIEDKILKEIYC